MEELDRVPTDAQLQEVEALVKALARSGSRWRLGHTSRHYVEHLRRTLL